MIQKTRSSLNFPTAIERLVSLFWDVLGSHMNAFYFFFILADFDQIMMEIILPLRKASEQMQECRIYMNVMGDRLNSQQLLKSKTPRVDES